MTAAVYIRVSTIDQAEEGYSLASQERLLLKYSEEHGYDKTKVYADEGISAKDVRHRPAMTQLLSDVQEGKYDAVIVWALSRLTRSVSDLYRMLEIFRANNTELISTTEAFDTGTPIGRAMVGFLGVFAQMEREITSDRVKVAIAQKVEQGGCPVSYIKGYDRDGDTLTVNEAEAEDIRFIYNAYMECENLLEVSRRCRQRNIKGRRGGEVKPETVKKILTCPVYAGKFRFRGKIYPSNHESIISPELFDEVQSRIFKTHPSLRAKYLT